MSVLTTSSFDYTSQKSLSNWELEQKYEFIRRCVDRGILSFFQQATVKVEKHLSKWLIAWHKGSTHFLIDLPIWPLNFAPRIIVKAATNPLKATAQMTFIDFIFLCITQWEILVCLKQRLWSILGCCGS